MNIILEWLKAETNLMFIFYVDNKKKKEREKKSKETI